jgi:hypothetical protein
MRATFCAGVLLLAGCIEAFDPDEPIDVVPIGPWDEYERAALDHAAECWNLGFGTKFRVVAAATAAQHLTVAFDASLCGKKIGLYHQDSDGGDITLCPASFRSWYKLLLFRAIAHELGHAAGIREHATGPTSTMGPGALSFDGVGGPMFSAEDHALYAKFNGEPIGACDPVIRLGNFRNHCECADPVGTN